MAERFGRYETIRAIASGGMATVHLARAVGAGGFERLVAIKVMHPHIAADPDFVAMFLDEARLAARVRHPNVVPTIDVHEDPLFLVMDYIEGPSLHTVLRELRRRQRRMSIDLALRVFLDILAGLHAAHDLTGPDGEPLNLVHRDVSPHNMLLGVDGIARITDFGVARAESRLSSTRGNQVKGKLAYMAPEQVRSEPVDRRTDVYAAAVVLFELLTGAPLFRADNDAALISTVVAGATMSPRQTDPSVPAGIDAVTMRALSLERAHRFATAADFADALEDAARADGQAIATPRALSSFLRELAVHEAAPSGLGVASTSSPGSMPQGAGPRAGSHSGADGARSASGLGPLGSGPADPSASSTNVGTLVAPPGVPTRSSKRTLGAAAAAAVAVVAGVIAFVGLRGSSDAGRSPASSVHAASTSAPAPTLSPSVTAQATTVTTASSVAAVPSGSAAPSIASTTKAAAGPTKPGADARPVGKPTAKPTSFRPDGL
jgi:serine/threonine-protein kinase